MRLAKNKPAYKKLYGLGLFVVQVKNPESKSRLGRL
jgi:hypothetical protein